MNFYDPKKSYSNKTNWTSRQIAEFNLDQNEYYGIQDLKSSLIVALPYEKIKFLLDNSPDVFDDVLPKEEQDMNEEELKQHKQFLTDLENGNSTAAKFVKFVEDKRAKKLSE